MSRKEKRKKGMSKFAKWILRRFKDRIFEMAYDKLLDSNLKSKVATTVNKRIDLKGLTEEQEQQLFESIYCTIITELIEFIKKQLDINRKD